MIPFDNTEEGPVRGRFVSLLISLSVLFLLYPVLIETGHARLFRIFFIFVLVAAVFSLSDRRRQMIVALALAVPTAITQTMALAAPGRTASLVAVTFALAFISYVVTTVLKAVLKDGKVTGDKIAGAVSGYLLLGLAWAMLYGLLALLQPGAFNAPDDMDFLGRPMAGAEYGFIYYSFVTLTTLGYGEVTPVSSLARTAAWVEAVTGQLYVAILLARLVALQIAEAHKDRERNRNDPHD